jgi:VCBS repeat-containing protein
LLSSSTVNENEPSGTTVGTLSATDPDTGDTHTFALVSGAGSTDNGSFAISGNALQTAASFDFETKNSYSVRIQATDAGGATFEQSFTINVANVNEAPIYNGYTLTAAKDTATTFLVAKVIVKTSDPEGNTRTISGVSSTSSQGGTAQLIGSSIKYTPPAGFVGSDSFSVTITDGSLSTTGFITVNVGGSTGSGPALVSVTVVGSDVQLKFSGIPGNHYDIQRSTTLVAPADWSTISTVTANSSGFVLYTDSSPPSPSYWRTLNNP